VTGAISGNLEVLEFDDLDAYREYKLLAEATGSGDLIRKLEAGYAEASPRGIHLPYRCAETAGNTVLAKSAEGKVLIETRGEGGFVIVSPSRGRVHPSGGEYQVLSGRVEDIQTIATSERAALWNLARAINAYEHGQDEGERAETRRGVNVSGTRPGDAFNAQATWEDILGPHGWHHVSQRGPKGYWRRPGKDRGVSATTGHTANDTLMVFSTSTTFQTEPHSYSKFGAYALLNHGGDHVAAAKELWRRGYGRETTGAARESSSDGPLTDAGNAEMFAERNAHRFRHDHAARLWMAFEGHWWGPDRDGAVVRAAKDLVRFRFAQGDALEDPDARRRAVAHALASESRQRIEAMLSLARFEAPLADSGDGWNADGMLFAVANGVLDLRAGTLRAGESGDRISLHSGVRFDPDATCPRWESFIGEVFAGDLDLMEFVQRAVGYSLTGDTSEQVVFLCHGAGANGKSTMLEVLSALSGGYGANLPFSAFELHERVGSTHDMAMLPGRRFVTASEVNEGTKLNAARIKALTGGDTVTARRLYQDYAGFVPVAKLWFAVNHLPVISDASDGMWRRVRLIPFARQFEGDAQDRQLKSTLLSELPGILNWALAGLRSWRGHGLKAPEAVMAATAEYRETSDTVTEFLADRCETSPGLRTLAGDLYRAYVQWASDSGCAQRDVMSGTAFGRRMGQRFRSEKTRAGKVYHGVGVAA
jgi:P4 family phage/plasmid primase-like protien